MRPTTRKTAVHSAPTLTKLQLSYDAGIKNITVKVNSAGTGYCIQNTKPTGVLYHKSGPGGDIVPNGC